MSKITRRTLARGGALCLVGVIRTGAPGLAQSDKRRWRMVTRGQSGFPGPCVYRELHPH
jgi:hypothetical protein